jgi:lysozyme
MSRIRIATASLAASAAVLVAIAVHEDYRGSAYLPTPNDRPTVGFGSTRRADGSPVRPGDTTTPVRALIHLHHDINATEAALHRCIGDVPLDQHEWDAYVSLAYNIGPTAFCSSTLVKKLKASPPDYAGACRQILRWDKQAGRVLPGLVKRREAEYRLCLTPVPGPSPSSPTPSPATP